MSEGITKGGSEGWKKGGRDEGREGWMERRSEVREGREGR